MGLAHLTVMLPADAHGTRTCSAEEWVLKSLQCGFRGRGTHHTLAQHNHRDMLFVFFLYFDGTRVASNRRHWSHPITTLCDECTDHKHVLLLHSNTDTGKPGTLRVEPSATAMCKQTQPPSLGGGGGGVEVRCVWLRNSQVARGPGDVQDHQQRQPANHNPSLSTGWSSRLLCSGDLTGPSPLTGSCAGFGVPVHLNSSSPFRFHSPFPFSPMHTPYHHEIPEIVESACDGPSRTVN